MDTWVPTVFRKVSAACPVLGLVPAGLWDSRPPVLGLVALAGGCPPDLSGTATLLLLAASESLYTRCAGSRDGNGTLLHLQRLTPLMGTAGSRSDTRP